MSAVEHSQVKPQFRLFALAFRPFFLVAGVAAIVLILPWLLILSGDIAPSLYFIPSLWHAHEMLFGFVAAVIGGFLLTAVQAWTGIPGISGVRLAALILTWCLGRIAMLMPPSIVGWAGSLLDLSFIPLIAWVLGSYVVQARQWRNAIFLPILALFFLANLAMHLQALGYANTANLGLTLGLWLTLLLIIILGGRVLPMFTSNGLGGVETHSWKPIEIGSILCFLLFVLADLFNFGNLSRCLALLCAIFHGIRLYGWRPLMTLETPLLWVLHIGYAWLVIAFLLFALGDLLLLPRSIAIHAFALGVVGNFVIGMMSRVALGHTGRALVAAKLTEIAYLLVNLAALFRVILPALSEFPWLTLMMLGGVSWSAAFLLFLVVYVPILSLARVDGKEG